MILTKSHYIRAQQCHKSLWFYKHKPELRAGRTDKVESLFASGISIGHYAKQLFPGGEEVQYIAGEYDGMVRKTNDLISQGVNTIYEAAFKNKNVFAMADILHKTSNGWDLYEVKSSTTTKDVHIIDAAMQYHAMSDSIKINKVTIAHINNQYERQGDLYIAALFTFDDITEQVKDMQACIESNIGTINTMLSSDLPDLDIGPYCQGEYPCDFHEHCWKHVSAPSVFNLYRLSRIKKFELYYNGVITYKDIPDDYPLSDTQQVQVQSSLKNKPSIDKEIIKNFLDGIEYPISFFDFETFQNPIPRFDGQRPYEKIPFQYSLHVINNNDSLTHKEFLGDENEDPRRKLAEQMLRDLPTTGSIVAFSQGFEKSQIKGLAKVFPDLSDSLLSLLPRFVDLLVPFRQLGYYHPDFNGSFSIKSVLPALFPNDPDLDYKKLGIQNGGEAMDTFANLYLLKDKKKREGIRKDLLAYCHLDTLAMVRIWERLRERY